MQTNKNAVYGTRHAHHVFPSLKASQGQDLQLYLAHKKTHPPRALQAYVQGPMVLLGDGRFLARDPSTLFTEPDII